MKTMIGTKLTSDNMYNLLIDVLESGNHGGEYLASMVASLTNACIQLKSIEVQVEAHRMHHENAAFGMGGAVAN